MHHFTFLSLLACLISFTSAVNFTYPNSNITLSRGSTYDLTWTSVDTDPTQFSIYLWNFKYFPPYYTFITQVQTSAHSQNVTVPCDVPSQDGWQFSAINGTNVYLIYAQTHNFTIDDTKCSSPTAGPNPEGTIVTFTSTATVTTTVRKGSTVTSTVTPTATVTVTKTVTKKPGKSTVSTVTTTSVSTTTATTTTTAAALAVTVTETKTKVKRVTVRARGYNAPRTAA